MQTMNGSTDAAHGTRPYRDLRNRVLEVLPAPTSSGLDVYDVMALLVKRTYGESVFHCKCGDWVAQVAHARLKLGLLANRLLELLVVTRGPRVHQSAKFFYDDRACDEITADYKLQPDEWCWQALMRTRIGIGLMIGHRIIADNVTEVPREYLRHYISDEKLQISHIVEQLSQVWERFPDEPAKAFNAFYEEDGWKVGIEHSLELADLAHKLRVDWNES